MAANIDMNVDEDLSPQFPRVKQDLEDKGWSVINDVVGPEDCDRYVKSLRDWLSQFGDGCPSHIGTVIHRYNISHHEVCWKVRRHCKRAFAGLWGTEKLMSSSDGISISEPPELGRNQFEKPGVHSLHLDQGPKKVGLHAYQGAVYLEDTDEEDWCLAVLEGSHKHHENFFAVHPPNPRSEFRRLTDDEVSWYEEKGCTFRRIPVKKGGIVVWDSRLVHMGAPPKQGRKNSARWRFVVFVTMTPAIWATQKDLTEKKKSYNDLRITRHWASSGVSLFSTYRPSPQDITELPDVAKTEEVRQLAGVSQYDFGDGQSNGPAWTPRFR